MVRKCLWVVPPAVNAMLPAFKMPSPTATVLVPEGLLMVRVPETDNATPGLMLKVVVAPVPKMIDVHAASALTVTLKPDASVTSSPATGTAAPGAPPEVSDQVAILFQFPVATEYFGAAFTAEVGQRIKAPKARIGGIENLMEGRMVFMVVVDD